MSPSVMMNMSCVQTAALPNTYEHDFCMFRSHRHILNTNGSAPSHSPALWRAAHLLSPCSAPRSLSGQLTLSLLQPPQLRPVPARTLGWRPASSVRCCDDSGALAVITESCSLALGAAGVDTRATSSLQ